MKFFAVFILAASTGFGAEFTTGQAARLVIGQTTFTAQEQGASQTLLGGVGGVAYAQDTLFVTDASRVSADPINHRVLLFRNLSSMLPAPTDELEYVKTCPVCGGTATSVLGQAGFTETAYSTPPTADTLRTPTAVASDGVRLAIADTDNNRVLIWNTIPTSNKAPADVVVGQADFKSAAVANPPTASSLRGPQGVWMQNGKLFVADTFNNRVLIWNSIPTTNGKAADVVLGQPHFGVVVESDITQVKPNPQSTTMVSPVSVTSDGQRLYVTDLGQNRVLVWNSIPTTNQQPADVVVGQPDMTSAASNNTTKLCAALGEAVEITAATNAYPVVFTTSADHGLVNGQTVTISGGTGKWTSVNGSFLVTVEDDTKFSISIDSSEFGSLSGSLAVQGYPDMCGATLDFPRFALSDGKQLFIADGGNDRVLVYNRIPTTNGQAADAVLGQPGDKVNLGSDAAYEWRVSSADSLRTPLSLAWDGLNLYVADPFNRRVMVFTKAEPAIPYTGVRNSASRAIYAVGSITFTGEIKEDDEITVKIGATEYKYTVVADDTLETLTTKFVELINSGSGDPLVYATPNETLATVILTARVEGEAGDTIEVTVTTSDEAKIQPSATAKLSGGKDAAKVAPGTIVQIVGENLSDATGSAPADADPLPTEVAGVQVYCDGVRIPLFFVSPTQINAQIPFDVYDRTGVSLYVRVRWRDGRVTVTNPVAVPIIGHNPGIFAREGSEPRAAVAMHYSSSATGTISVDGSAIAGDVLNILIEDRKYTYVVQEGDTLTSIRDAFVSLINKDPKVEAFPSSIWTRIRLRARVPGPIGNGIAIGVDTPEGASAILTPFNSELCCANEAGSLITDENPAMPGETIVIYATGLGMIKPDVAQAAIRFGTKYTGPALNQPEEFVSSLLGGKTANVLATGLKPGAVGIYEVHLELNSGQPTNPLSQLTIAQSDKVSNIATIPVYNPRAGSE
ncbi:MAG: hypothetical protein ACE141_09800 [Bryobacteraceae bacterium]